MITLSLPESNNQMRVSVILDSISTGARLRLTTIHVRVPRIIWPEILTHRMFGRNARSSRAVPAKTMLREIRETPFVPWRWTANQPGMKGKQGHEEQVNISEITGTKDDDLVSRENAWLTGRDKAVELAEAFAESGYHKQIFNRLVEPYMWIDGLITSCQWNNFFWLRDHEDAEPHFEDAAKLIRQAFSESNAQEIRPGEWHLPYIDDKDRDEAKTRFGDDQETAEAFLRKISAARCARISYAPFDGDASYEAELKRYDLLVRSDRVHASPLEHQATPDRKLVTGDWDSPHLHGNLPGFIQARKLVSVNFVPG